MADEKFRVDGGFIATGNSKITGTLDLTGTILNVGAGSDIASKGYVDQIVDNALIGVELGSGSVSIAHGQAAADWGETMEWTVKNTYTRSGSHGILQYSTGYYQFGFGIGFDRTGTLLVAAGTNLVRIYTWDEINEVWVNTHHYSNTAIGTPSEYNTKLSVADDGSAFAIIGQNNLVSYIKSGGAWIPQTVYATGSSSVGCDISADGLTLVHGLPSNTSVRKYTRATPTTTSWTYVSSFAFPDPNSRGRSTSAKWGKQIALNSDGTQAVITAPGDEAYLEESNTWAIDGRMYVMDLSTNALIQTIELPSTATVMGSNLGNLMGASNDLSIIVASTSEGMHCWTQNESGVWNWVSEWKPSEDMWSASNIYTPWSLSVSEDGRVITTSTQTLRASMFVNDAILPVGFAYIVTQASGILSTRARMSPEVVALSDIYGYGLTSAVSRDGNTIGTAKGGSNGEVGAIGEFVYVNKKIQVQI